MSTTEIAVVESAAFLALNRSTADIQSIISDNLAGQDVGEFDLPRVTLPAGGATQWEIDSPLTGTVAMPELEGIVVYTRQTRAYWESQDATGDPPQCSSRDGVVGVGKPGGECRTCPFAQFGSDEKSGRGQACKQQAMWFLLRPDSFLPLVLGMPPTSLKAAKQYMLALAGAGIRHTEVVTTIGLEREQNPDGQRYSRAVPRLGAKLDPEAAEKARAYADVLRPIFDAQPVEPVAQPGPTKPDGPEED